MIALKILEQSDKKLTFTIDTDVGFANALRRVMMNEVPVLAVEQVIFEDNNSGLFDEVVAHRLGLLPLAFDQKSMGKKSECKCGGKGCSRCEVRLTLEKQGPAMVLSDDLVCDGVVPEKGVPIVELLDNQRIKLEAVAQLGVGTDHTKFQSAIVGYSEGKTGFTFSVESVCGLSARAVLESALDVLEERTESFLKEFKKATK